MIIIEIPVKDGRGVLGYLFKNTQLVEDAQPIRLEPNTGPFAWGKTGV